MNSPTTVTVRHAPERHRYELVDGDAVIGKAHYVPHEGRKGPERIFHHTTVSEDYAGQGLAARLSQRLGEGVVNGLMTVRVGIAAMRVVRPLPFTTEPTPMVKDFLPELANVLKPNDPA